MTTPIERLTRLLNEGARFMVELPGNIIIDVTPDVIGALAEVQTGSNTFEDARNLLKTND